MPDSASTAKFYRERAEECRRLAGITRLSEIRSYYLQIAEYYITLANAEDTLAEKARAAGDHVAGWSVALNAPATYKMGCPTARRWRPVQQAAAAGVRWPPADANG